MICQNFRNFVDKKYETAAAASTRKLSSIDDRGPTDRASTFDVEF